MKNFVHSALIAAAALLLGACSMEYSLDGSYAFDGMEREARTPSKPTGGNGNSSAGIVTAGEWKDLDHWDFWSGLMQKSFKDKSEYWSFWTNNRIAVMTRDESGAPAPGIPVEILRGGKVIWKAVTDNKGRADAWVGLFQKEEDPDSTTLSISIDGSVRKERPVMSHWDGQGKVKVNTYTVRKTAADRSVDIAFIVDATGSMQDEIDFLKDDLQDLLEKARSAYANRAMRAAALFYRDEGDDYLTRYKGFSSDFKKISEFVGKQNANGGGDYPEAVHTALEDALQKLDWNPKALNRIAFLVLDAPAHHTDEIVENLNELISQYAALGIRIIPVTASGTDKSTEFMCRFFAAATGGTYVFITNDSGVGGDHIEASVGEYKVEQLNELMVRLIKEYAE